jgi:ATP-dependent HslUV protease subunit HslV
MFALAAARALIRQSDLSARVIAVDAMKIASEVWIYTIGVIVVEEL